MKLILLSGGSGKRLWPLSNDTRSKQFLRMLESEENGVKESMLERVWGQINKIGLGDSTIVATSKSQREIISNQLGSDIPIITEPHRRDTFPAIALAVSYLFTIEKMSEDETILVMPVDPYVDIKFFDRLKELESLLTNSNADIALMGVKPTYPSSKYGYIIPKDNNDFFVTVDKFIEKPSEEEAELLIKKDALWNCGVFGFKLKYLLSILQENKVTHDYYELEKNYQNLEQISFDYKVVENANKIVALPYDGYWKDLGTWNTLTEEMASSQVGKGIISEDSYNSHLINELDIPVAVLGVQNLVVAASPDGILISDKKSSPKIKELIKDFDNPPMYEERLWGWSRTLDYSTYENGEEMLTKRICIKQGKNSTYHFHKFRDEVWTIIKGEGELMLDGSIRRIKAGDVIHLPSFKKHSIKAISDLEFIEVQTGSSIIKDDIYRLAYEWHDVLTYFKESKPSFII